jgi:hypothetical protein
MSSSHWSVFMKGNKSKRKERVEDPKLTGKAGTLIVEDPLDGNNVVLKAEMQ